MISLTTAPTRCKAGFPKCELYGTRIVNGFPVGCPFRAKKPYDVVHAIGEAAFSQDDSGEACHRWNMADVCRECVAKNLTNPAVQRLRRRAVA